MNNEKYIVPSEEEIEAAIWLISDKVNSNIETNDEYWFHINFLKTGTYNYNSKALHRNVKEVRNEI